MLDEVWRFLANAPPGLRKDGHNVMLYLDDAPTVEVGVQVDRTFERKGAVVHPASPDGRVATAKHTGPIDRLGDTHDVVCAWCAANGHRLTRVQGRFRIDLPSPYD